MGGAGLLMPGTSSLGYEPTNCLGSGESVSSEADPLAEEKWTELLDDLLQAESRSPQLQLLPASHAAGWLTSEPSSPQVDEDLFLEPGQLSRLLSASVIDDDLLDELLASTLAPAEAPPDSAADLELQGAGEVGPWSFGASAAEQSPQGSAVSAELMSQGSAVVESASWEVSSALGNARRERTSVDQRLDLGVSTVELGDIEARPTATSAHMLRVDVAVSQERGLSRTRSVELYAEPVSIGGQTVIAEPESFGLGLIGKVGCYPVGTPLTTGQESHHVDADQESDREGPAVPPLPFSGPPELLDHCDYTLLPQRVVMEHVTRRVRNNHASRESRAKVRSRRQVQEAQMCELRAENSQLTGQVFDLEKAVEEMKYLLKKYNIALVNA